MAGSEGLTTAVKPEGPADAGAGTDASAHGEYSILDWVPAAVCVLSADDLRVLYANRAFQRLVASEAASAGGRPIGEVLPAGCEGVLDLIGAARDCGRPVHVANLRCGSEEAPDRAWSVHLAPRPEEGSGRVGQLVLLLSDAGHQVALARAAERAAEAERQRAEQLDATFASIADAVVLVDEAGRMRKCNAAAAIMFDLDESSAISIDSPALALHRADGTALAAAESPLARALRMEVVRREEALVLRPGRPRRVVAVTAAPLVTANGVSGAVAVFHDITQIRDAEQRAERALEAERARTREARTLYEAARALSSDLNLRERLSAVAATMAEAVGVSRCYILLLEGGTVKGAAAFGLTPAQDERLRGESLPRRALGAATEQALEGRQAVYVADATSAALTSRRLARVLNMRSVLIVPLVYGNRVTGIAYLDEPGTRREFSEAEQAMASAIAAQAAVAIENARLYEVEQDRARMLEMMMAELNHRIKNNLAIVCGLLSLQLTQADPGATRESVLRDCITRIQSISLIHQMLYEEDLDAVELKETIERIGAMVCDTLAAPGQRITFSVRGDRLLLPCKFATSLGLAVNELICNAVKHGLAGRPRGEIRVSVRAGTRIRVSVSDNGRGLPDGFDLTRDAHVGVVVVRGLVEAELGGTFTLRNGVRAGAIARISFPFAGCSS